MNKVYTLVLCAMSVFAFSSCEKCSTCTSTSEDPETFGNVITDEVCGRGNNYDDQVELYTRSDWNCTENN